jgi:membrane-associated phospholipid phosphatase
MLNFGKKILGQSYRFIEAGMPYAGAMIPGLGMLSMQMGIMYGLTTYGIPPFLSAALMSTLKNWVLWDPKITIFRLHDMGLSVATAAILGILGDYEGLKQLAKVHIVTGIITESLKNIARRKRPNGGSNKSFPSGHASASFAWSSFIHRYYGLQWGLPAMAISSTVGCVRVHKKAHYVSDVFAGAGIGILTAYCLVNAKSVPLSAAMPSLQGTSKLSL